MNAIGNFSIQTSRMFALPAAAFACCCFALIFKASAPAAEPIQADWRFYLQKMGTHDWDYFGRIDGDAFKAKFWPMLQDSKLATNSDFLFVCGAGVVNWADRHRSLSKPEREQYYKQSLPLLIQASEFGHWHAMWEAVGMLQDGLGTQRDLPQAMRWASNALELCNQQFGPEHTNTATSLGVLAHQYQLRREHKKAEPLYLRCL